MNTCECGKPSTLLLKIVTDHTTRIEGEDVAGSAAIYMHAVCDEHVLEGAAEVLEQQAKLGGRLVSVRERSPIDVAVQGFPKYSNTTGSEKLHALIVAVMEVIDPKRIRSAKTVARVLGESPQNAKSFLERSRNEHLIETYEATDTEGATHVAYRIKRSLL